MEFKISHRGQKVIDSFNDNITISTVSDFNKFKTMLESYRDTASICTHYDKLNDWMDPINIFIADVLKKNGFKNGDVDANNILPNVKFWWNVYCMVNNIIYSPNLPYEDVANHHSSAFARNEALYIEVCLIIKEINK